MIDSFTVGVIGMTCILLAFLLHMAGKWKRNLRRYIFFEMVGSALLTYYAFQINSIPFMILNGILAIASLYGLITSQRGNKGPAVFEA